MFASELQPKVSHDFHPCLMAISSNREGHTNGSVPVCPDHEIEMDTAIPDSHPPSSASPSNSAASAIPPVGEPHSETGGTCTEDDQLKQLQQDLSALIDDRDSLTASLKTARRDAQKAEAALRSEIEALKRSSEKHSAAEHRGRQKVLALQEAVKRAQAATSDMENIAKEVEAALPLLMAEQDKKVHAYDTIRSEVDRAKEESHRESQTDRKRVDDLKGELAGLTNKLERLHGKKDRLENGLLPKLEEQLRFIEKEIQQVEPILFASGVSSDAHDPMPDDAESVGGNLASDIKAVQAMFPSRHRPTFHHPVQRQRHKSQDSPGTIGRPGLIPVQRPSSLNQQSWASTLASHGTRPSVSPQPHKPSLRPLVVRPSVQPQGAVGPSSHPATSNPSSPIAPFVPASTLSSRAPVFEPSPSITHSYRTAASTGPVPAAVNHPTAAIPVYHPKPSAVSRVVGKGNTKWANGQSFSNLAHQKQGS
jgi:vacuolar-type H+-ATPase subunit D/Vma8